MHVGLIRVDAYLTRVNYDRLRLDEELHRTEAINRALSWYARLNTAQPGDWITGRRRVYVERVVQVLQ